MHKKIQSVTKLQSSSSRWLYVIHLTSASNLLHGCQHSVVRSSTEHLTENLLLDKTYTLTW